MYEESQVTDMLEEGLMFLFSKYYMNMYSERIVISFTESIKVP